MINCGNCLGKHETASEVRECYANGRPVTTEDPCEEVHPDIPKQPEQLATQKQIDFINKLTAERYVAEHNPIPHPERLSKKQASSMIDGLLKTPKLPGREVRMPGGTIVAGPMPKPGTFTVVMGAERRTIRIQRAKMGRLAGKLVFKFLSGPDNNADYTAFGEEAEDGVKVWSRFRANSEVLDALKYLMGMSDTEKAQAGLTYALESNNCYVCGRTLTVPASVHAGIGPICAEKGLGY
jgi:hypothetical protein